MHGRVQGVFGVAFVGLMGWGEGVHGQPFPPGRGRRDINDDIQTMQLKRLLRNTMPKGRAGGGGGLSLLAGR